MPGLLIELLSHQINAMPDKHAVVTPGLNPIMGDTPIFSFVLPSVPSLLILVLASWPS